MVEPPFKTEFDPPQEGEGSQDPLGLQPAYERLANRLLPALTVRMGRPRFLTAMAIGARICEGWKDTDVAVDGITPAWLVYEWYVVEAFSRAKGELVEGSSIPGNQKISRAINTGRPVNVNAYLKTPTVFGFTGIYRRLANGGHVLTESGRLDDAGWELISAWERDQSLPSFVSGSDGTGYDFRREFVDAVAKSMEKGHTVRKPPEFWSTLAKKLDPANPGRREANVLLGVITSRSGSTDMVSALVHALRGNGPVFDRPQEGRFLRQLARTSTGELRKLLDAIDAYEGLCRALTCAFDAVRYGAFLTKGIPFNSNAYQRTAGVDAALSSLMPVLRRVIEDAGLMEWEEEWVADVSGRFQSVHNAADLFEAILAHHQNIQGKKPPDGKRSWFEKIRPGQIIVRAAYQLEHEPDTSSAYVHEYRIPTFSRFLRDVGGLG